MQLAFISCYVLHRACSARIVQAPSRWQHPGTERQMFCEVAAGSPTPLLLATDQSWRPQATSTGLLGRKMKAVGTRASLGPCSLSSIRTSQHISTGHACTTYSIRQGLPGSGSAQHTHLLIYSALRSFPQVLHLKQPRCQCLSKATRAWPFLISKPQPPQPGTEQTQISSLWAQEPCT